MGLGGDHDEITGEGTGAEEVRTARREKAGCFEELGGWGR